MKRNNVIDKSIGHLKPYKGHLYMVSCIGVEYDYDIVEHFIKYYKKLGFDKFLIVLQTIVPNSERLLYVQSILRKYNIKEKFIWRKPFCFRKHPKLLMKIAKENTNIYDWISITDVDEFIDYHCDLRKLVSHLEREKYEYAWASRIDRCTLDGKPISIDKNTDLFKAFPVKINLTGILRHAGLVTQIILNKSYVRLQSGMHNVKGNHRAFPQKFITHHFKFRSNMLEETRERLKFRKKNGDRSWKLSEAYIAHYEKYNSFNIPEK